MTADLEAILAGTRILPVLTIPSAETAAPLADALTEGGARCAEVTLRTPDAERALEAMAAHGGLTVGAGTVLTADQARRAVAAGAAFVVSPGFDPDVVAACRELGVPVLPGIATATELMQAMRAGIHTVKLFPAEQIGGILTLRALAGPFPGVRFVPTGGIGPGQVAEYLAQPAVSAIGGSWLAPPDLQRQGEYEEIRRRTAEAVEASAA